MSYYPVIIYPAISYYPVVIYPTISYYPVIILSSYFLQYSCYLSNFNNSSHLSRIAYQTQSLQPVTLIFLTKLSTFISNCLL